MTGLILSFSDWRCFILEFEILKSTMGCKLTGLSSLETWDKSDKTYKTIMFSNRNCLSLILVYLKIVCVLFIIHRMDKRKSFVFARQYRNYFSRRINALLPKINQTKGHWHGDAQFSWLEDNDILLRCRHCLLLTSSYRDNPIFFMQCNI